jgi:hypothetical protein
MKARFMGIIFLLQLAVFRFIDGVAKADLSQIHFIPLLRGSKTPISKLKKVESLGGG